MNPKQNKLLQIGLPVMVLMGLVPPWTATLHYQSIHWQRSAGYSLIFEPPKAEGLYSVTIDFGRLLVQWAAVSFVIGGGIFYFREPEKK